MEGGVQRAMDVLRERVMGEREAARGRGEIHEEGGMISRFKANGCERGSLQEKGHFGLGSGKTQQLRSRLETEKENRNTGGPISLDLFYCTIIIKFTLSDKNRFRPNLPPLCP